ncbi:hypothetical protein [Sphingobacterium sp. UBA5670]|uniref:hypothetical protein n=1 Tax=Sphingobacterium sp. UBA5670 TaxID=1947502 RepID=UPI0025D9875B|nr:hypothetical protein [Sphingobacterium sp. UBA5670]
MDLFFYKLNSINFCQMADPITHSYRSGTTSYTTPAPTDIPTEQALQLTTKSLHASPMK